MGLTLKTTHMGTDALQLTHLDLSSLKQSIHHMTVTWLGIKATCRIIVHNHNQYIQCIIII